MKISKNIISIDSNDDDKIDYNTFNKYLEEDTTRKKNRTVLEIESMGEDLLVEIEIKKSRNEIKKQKLILYILKHSKYTFSEQVLKSYSYDDVLKIYNELKENRSVIAKIFHFIFNIE